MLRGKKCEMLLRKYITGLKEKQTVILVPALSINIRDLYKKIFSSIFVILKIFDTFSQLESVFPILTEWGFFYSFFFPLFSPLSFSFFSSLLFLSLFFTLYVQTPMLCTAKNTTLNRSCFLLNELTVL